MTCAARSSLNRTTSLRRTAALQGYRAYPDGYGVVLQGAVLPSGMARGESPILPDAPRASRHPQPRRGQSARVSFLSDWIPASPPRRGAFL